MGLNNIDFGENTDEMAENEGLSSQSVKGFGANWLNMDAGAILIREKFLTSLFKKAIILLFALLVGGILVYTALNPTPLTIVTMSLGFVFFIIVSLLYAKG
jgi:hypothetical protein